ncbi:MAG: DUF3570 domain-containing protein [Saprospiraceae bacterium]|nr:DUF3570 domain-containing protein [Saprospiraceae bacterium]
MTIVFVVFVSIQEIKAQIGGENNGNKDQLQSKEDTEISATYQRSDWQKVEINFLNSYYSQDGDNSAVTGGIGTEQLTDFTQKVTISIPTSPSFKLNLDGSYDYYSSASTDNIDNVRSSDSSSDVRTQFGIGMEYTPSEQWTAGFRVGGSVEYDYYSFQVGGNLSYGSKDGNRRLDLSTQAFIDQWAIYLPNELKGEVSVPTDKRQSYNAALAYSQVLNRRMQMSLMVEGTYMNGLLSTPFHRVYFQGSERATIEKLPDNRLKIPLGIRWNYYMNDKIILRSYYRYYWDSWGIKGHTASIELPIKLNRFFAVYPHYRFHQQSAADYFLPYQEHLASNEFYTSDYDLAGLTSHTYGLGVLYSQPDGIASVKIPFVNKKLSLDAIDLKGSIYNRSTGLNGFIISVGAKVNF